MMNLPKDTFQITESKTGYSIRIKNSKKAFHLKELEYYLELALLVEALKVEGYWNKNGNMAISSKTPELVFFFKNLFDEHDLSVRIEATVKTPPIENLNIDTIKVLENGKERNFHFGRNGFTNKIDRIVFNTQIRAGQFEVRYGNTIKKINLKVDNQLLKNSNDTVRLYYTLKSSNKAFVKFCEDVLGEKNKSHEIRANTYLKDSSAEQIIKVFGTVVDCEGSVRFNSKLSHYRNIHIRMKNKEYLHDWKKILNKLGINSHLRKDELLWNLTITCNQNFKRLKSFGFELHHPDKKKRFKQMLNSYQKHQVERNTASKYYTQLINNNPGKSALELSTIANKSKRVISHYLVKLFRAGIISRKKVTKQKYTYFPKN